MGVAMLRLVAGLVMGWMERFVNLQNAAYLTVLAVGLKLTAKVLAPALAPSEAAVPLMPPLVPPVAAVQVSSSSGSGV